MVFLFADHANRLATILNKSPKWEPRNYLVAVGRFFRKSTKRDVGGDKETRNKIADALVRYESTIREDDGHHWVRREYVQKFETGTISHPNSRQKSAPAVG